MLPQLSYFLQVTAVVYNYNRKYLPMQLFWNITFGVFMGAKASYQLKLSFPGHMSHVAQDTSISTLLHEFPWWKVVRGSFTTCLPTRVCKRTFIPPSSTKERHVHQHLLNGLNKGHRFQSFEPTNKINTHLQAWVQIRVARHWNCNLSYTGDSLACHRLSWLCWGGRSG